MHNSGGFIVCVKLQRCSMPMISSQGRVSSPGRDRSVLSRGVSRRTASSHHERIQRTRRGKLRESSSLNCFALVSAQRFKEKFRGRFETRTFYPGLINAVLIIISNFFAVFEIFPLIAGGCCAPRDVLDSSLMEIDFFLRYSFFFLSCGRRSDREEETAGRPRAALMDICL